MTIKQGILKSFNSTSYTATVEISGSARAYLEGVAVARNIAAGEMVTGRRVAVIFFDEHQAREAVVAGVWA
jgi:hypothetical protein